MPRKTSIPSIKVHRQHLVMTRHIRHARSALNIRPPGPHHLPFPLNRHLIPPRHPIPHRTRQDDLAIGLPDHSAMGRIPDDVLVEAVAAVAAVGGGDGRGAVAALFEGDVAVGGAVVGGGELELDPGGREGRVALDAAFEGGGEGDEGGGVGADGGGFEGVGEVAAGGAVTVPVWMMSVLEIWRGLVGGEERMGGGGGEDTRSCRKSSRCRICLICW